MQKEESWGLRWRLHDQRCREFCLALITWVIISSLVLLVAYALTVDKQQYQVQDFAVNHLFLPSNPLPHLENSDAKSEEIDYTTSLQASFSHPSLALSNTDQQQTEQQGSVPVGVTSPAQSEDLPQAVLVPSMAFLEVPNRPQERNLSCEFQSAADLALYYGWEISWREIFLATGVDTGGNPNLGFVGKSIDDPPGSLFPNGYGVYAEPIARGLRRLGINAVGHKGVDIMWLKRSVSSGHPVVVWATYGMKVHPVVQWQASDGQWVQGVPFEHTFTVVGYDQGTVWVNNPWSATRERYSWQEFDAAWALLDRMALTINEAIPTQK